MLHVAWMDRCYSYWKYLWLVGRKGEKVGDLVGCYDGSLI